MSNSQNNSESKLPSDWEDWGDDTAIFPCFRSWPGCQTHRTILRADHRQTGVMIQLYFNVPGISLDVTHRTILRVDHRQTGKTGVMIQLYFPVPGISLDVKLTEQS